MINRILKFPFLLLIKFYHKAISPFLPHRCRFQPTCSQYMLEAIQIHGIIKGICLGTRRLLRCHPWGGSGFDPVPPKSNRRAGDKNLH